MFEIQCLISCSQAEGNGLKALVDEDNITVVMEFFQKVEVSNISL